MNRKRLSLSPSLSPGLAGVHPPMDANQPATNCSTAKKGAKTGSPAIAPHRALREKGSRPSSFRNGRATAWPFRAANKLAACWLAALLLPPSPLWAQAGQDESPGGSTKSAAGESSEGADGEADVGASASEPPDFGSDYWRGAPPEASGEEVDPRVEYHKGNMAFEEGRLTAARYHYQRSYEADPSFDAMCNWGRTEEQIPDDVSAYVHLTQCLKLHPTDSTLKENREKYVLILEEVASRLTPQEKVMAERRLAREFPEEEEEPSQADSAPEGGAYDPVAEEPRDSKGRAAVSLGMGVVGLAGLAVGSGFFVHSIEQGTAADELQQEITGDGGTCVEGSRDARCDELVGYLESSDESHLIGVVGLAAGGALTAGAILTYLVWPKKKEGTHAVDRASGAPRMSAARRSEPLVSSVRPSVAFHPTGRVTFLSLSGRF